MLITKMNENIRNYIETIVHLTFGFVPEFKIVIPYEGIVQVWFNGSDEERSNLIGKEGQSIKAITRFIYVFGRRNKWYTYVYVLPQTKVDNQT